MPGERKTNDAEVAFRALLRVCGLIGRIMQPYFARLGISGSQWGVLIILYRAEQEGRPCLRILELGDRLLVRPPSVSGLVTRLQRLGYVRRVLPKSDHRCKEVHLTDTGRELVRRILESHGSQVELLMSGLDKEELLQLSRFVDRLGNHLDTIAREPNVPVTSNAQPAALDAPAGSQQ